MARRLGSEIAARRSPNRAADGSPAIAVVATPGAKDTRLPPRKHPEGS
ncbi:MAG: hypothetical protein M3464_12060 [Chloroflexota bacterium]|nr:hypothetical protein [Chloroflexota bacterium]